MGILFQFVDLGAAGPIAADASEAEIKSALEDSGVIYNVRVEKTMEQHSAGMAVKWTLTVMSWTVDQDEFPGFYLDNTGFYPGARDVSLESIEIMPQGNIPRGCGG